jgi:hypothetical protein
MYAINSLADQIAAARAGEVLLRLPAKDKHLLRIWATSDSENLGLDQATSRLHELLLDLQAWLDLSELQDLDCWWGS